MRVLLITTLMCLWWRFLGYQKVSAGNSILLSRCLCISYLGNVSKFLGVVELDTLLTYAHTFDVHSHSDVS